MGNIKRGFLLIFLTFQFTVSGHLGVDGPLALSPVDVELERDIEVGKRSELLKMVVGDVAVDGDVILKLDVIGQSAVRVL